MLFSSFFAVLFFTGVLAYKKKFSVLSTYKPKDFLTLFSLGFVGIFLQYVFLYSAIYFSTPQEAFIINKIQQHKSEDYPLCTMEERWNNGDKYAVMKKGRKKALRVFDNEKDAMIFQGTTDDKIYIEQRKGENKRCENYCKCVGWCQQYKAMKNEQ